MLKKNTIPLDIWTSLKYSDWIDEFYYPINVSELGCIRKNLELEFINFLQKEKNDHNKRLFKVVINHLIIEIFSLYESIFVLQQYKINEEILDASQQNPTWSLKKSLLENKMPNTPILNLENAGFKSDVKNKIIRHCKNLIKAVINLDKSFWYRKQAKFCFPVPVTFEYVESQHLSVDNIKKELFFPKNIRDLIPSQNDTRVIELSQKLSTLVYDFFRENRISEVELHVQKYIFNTIFNLFDITNRYTHWIKKNLKHFPMQLIAGSGHNYYVRLLGSIIAERSGKVICAEHSDTNAIYKTSYQGYGEFGICNSYIVYSKSCATLYNKNWAHTLKLQDELPDMIISKNGENKLKALFNKYKNLPIGSNTKKVMYVASGFRNDFTHLITYFPDMVYLEWQNDLFAYLRKVNYDVICKYHPETILSGNRFEPISGISYLYGQFEEYLDSDLIYIFDHPMSTAFCIAMCTNKPILLITNGALMFDDEAYLDLAQRCEIIEGYHDDRNRFRVDTTILELAIEKASRNKNYTFIKKYFIG